MGPLSYNNTLDTLFAPEVTSFVTYLHKELTATTKEQAIKNLDIIDEIIVMNKTLLEAYMSQVMLVSLNNEEFDYIKTAVKNIKNKNQSLLQDLLS